MGDFEVAVERLKLSAIDAFMCGPGRDGGGNHQIAYDPDFGSLSYYVGMGGKYRRPGGIPEAKEGWRVEDSALSGKKEKPCWVSEEFERIRSRIEEIVDRWRDTPDLRRIDDLVGRFGEASIYFKGTLPRPDGSTALVHSILDELRDVVEAALDDNLDGDYGETEGLQGEGFRRFRDYLTGFLEAIVACNDVVQVINGAITTERELWEVAMAGAAKTINLMADACDVVTTRSAAHVDVDDLLNVLALSFGIVSCVPSPIQLPAGIVSVGLSAVTTVIGLNNNDFRAIDYVDPTPGPIPTYSDAIDVLSHLLNGSVAGVDQRVTATEEAINGTLSDAISEIYSPSGGSRFDPVAGPITEKIRTDPTRANTIIEHMNTLADLLDSTSTKIQDCLDLPADTLRRHSRIGIGRDGPYLRIVELLELLQILIKQLSDEAYAAAENFRLSQEALYRAEDDAQSLIQSARDFRSADAFTAIDARRLRQHLSGMPRIGRF